MKNLLMLILLGGCFTCALAQINTYPYHEDFESETTCTGTCNATCNLLSTGWANIGVGDNAEWTSDLGGTSSGGTGPSVDHNPGTSTGYYLYVESSSGCSNRVAILLSPVFDLTAVDAPQLEFWYHMLGSTMGTLEVDISTDGGTNWSNLIPEFTDNQDLWQQQIVDLSAYTSENTVRFRFTGRTGSLFNSDMAIDDFSIRAQEVPIPTMGEWSLFLFGLILFNLGVVVLYNIHQVRRMA